jgi:hypothetical protein
MEYVGDDYVLLDLEPRPRALAIHGTAKLHADALALLPGLAAVPRMVEAGDGVKAVLDLSRHRANLLTSEVPLAAIVLPRVAAGGLRLRPARAAEALRALGPNTVLQASHDSSGGLAVVAELVKRLPAFSLYLGDDPAAVPAAIDELLAGLP